MNMISTGAFQTEMDASNKQTSLAEKFAAVWEKKNAKAARAGGVSLMALSLAACGSDDTTTTATDTTTTVTTPVVVVPAAQSFTLTTASNTFTGGDGADTFTGATASTSQAFDTLDGGAGTDSVVLTDILSSYAGATGIGATVKNMEGLTVNTNAGLGTVAVAASGAVDAQAAQAQVQTITPLSTGTFANTDTLTINIGSASYTTTVHSGTAGKDKAGASIKAVLDAHLGNDQNAGTGGFTATVDTDVAATTGIVTITSHKAGMALPTITVTSSTAADTVAVADTTVNKVAIGPGAIKEIVQITTADAGNTANAATDIEAGTAITVSLDGVDYVGGSVQAGAASTAAEFATNIASIINSAMGTGTATSSGAVVTVTAPTAGTQLPLINVKVATATDFTNTQASMVANQGAIVAASGLVAEKVFDVSGFTGDVNLTAAGNAVVKASATANVTLSNTSGSSDVTGGGTVAIVTSGTGTSNIDGAAITSAAVTGGGNVTIDNLGGTAGTTTSTGTTMTAASLSKITGTTAAIKGAAVTDVDITTQQSALAVTLTNGTSTTLDLDLDGVGYDAAGTAVVVSVAAGATAKTVSVDTASKSNITITEPGAVVTTLNLSGAGALTADISGLTATTLTSTASGATTLGTLNAATKAITMGAGADTMTVAATDKNVSVSTGDGNDSVTVGALAAGAAVDLGGGDDDLVASGGAVAALTAALPAVIDGGAGTDMISSALVNAGNSSRITGFEVLGMAAGSGTVDTAIITGMTGLEMLAQGATYSNVAAGTTIDIDANVGTASSTIVFSAVTGKTDAFTIDFGAKGAAASTAASPTSIDGGTLVLAGIENLTINSGQTSGFVNNTIDVTAANAKTIVVTGAADTTTIAFAATTGTQTSATDEAVSSIDTSALVGDLTLDTANVVAATSGMVLNTGTGKDGLTVSQKVTINSGTGVDTVTFALGSQNSTITAGADNDVLDIKALVHASGAAAQDTGEEILVTLADYNAGDTIDFSGGTESAETLGTAVSITATDLETALDQIATGSGTTHFAWGQYNGNTYVVHNADKGSGTDSALENGDVVLALTGLVALADSTVDTGGILTIV